MPTYKDPFLWRLYVRGGFGVRCLGHYETEQAALEAVSKYYPSVPVQVVRETDGYRCQGGHLPYRIRSNRKD